MPQLDEGKADSALLGLARKLQAALKAVFGKPVLEQEGRYLILTVNEPSLEHVTQTVVDALPSKWREFKTGAADEEAVTTEFAPVRRVGAPFVTTFQADSGDQSVVLMGTYIEQDLEEGVLLCFANTLVEHYNLAPMLEKNPMRTHLAQTLAEKSPPGWEGTVKAMKKHPEIDNPWALAWSMKNKGKKSHYKLNKKKQPVPKEESLGALIQDMRAVLEQKD